MFTPEVHLRKGVVGSGDHLTVRIGILGTGNISGTHARAASEVANVEVAACWGRDMSKAKSFAAQHGGAAYDDLERFLEHPGLDVIVVGTPSGMHATHGIAAARHGKHVLVEKPLDISTARVDALIDACDRAGVTLGVIFQDRSVPELQWLRRAIADKALGEITLASASVRWYRPPEYYAGSSWRGTVKMDGGGALINQGVHTVDLLLWLLGDVTRVAAATRTTLHAIEVEDTAVACLEFASGAVGTLEVTTAAPPGFPRRLEISGTKGSVVVEGDRLSKVELATPAPGQPLSTELNANASASSPVVKDVRGHRRVIEDFLTAIRTGSAPLCDGRDGRRSVALVEAIYGAASPNAAPSEAPRPLHAGPR